ncbi:uncharacterized protein LOC124927850 [Impatiens glandulifera]|uniref:uncharacterized protein LOC124927850 n=1 Tax=Impatiens glandulifera TaxID=253017 RepID=UPI001FB0C93C|nr:uncharacterized protein LOC124927850 [Impatiens glandulifera]
MESSDKVTIGSIVWVRRRNGSWWPGKILGPDELSASNIMSPRSGTPVKLLGREDASVDWYNLEKSKRVKEFRCVEFENCILKVEASLGLPPKKREKYARREDAILHALELEKDLMEKKHVRDSILPLESMDNGRGENPLAHESSDGMISKPFYGEAQSVAVCDTNRDRFVSLRGKSGDLIDNDHPGSRKSISVSASQMGNYGPAGFSREAAAVSGSVEDTETDTAGTDEDSARIPEDGIITVLEPKSSRSSELQWKHEITSNDEHDDFASGGGNTPIVSKWKLKRKRNSRGIVKRSIHHTRDNNNNILSKSPISGTNFTGDERNHRSQSVLNNKRQSVTANSILIDTEYSDHDMIDWEELSWNHQERRLLLDVDVKVQASYKRRQDVPMISLISKLNGHAIVGHHIPVESIENCKFLVNNEKSVPLTKRTTVIPRPDEVIHADIEGKHKKLSGGGGYKATTVPKKKKKKKISLLSSSSQKIKTLSSIGRYGGIVSYKEDDEEGAMKGETTTGLTAVACIPVKLVFSRLHEKLVSRHH